MRHSMATWRDIAIRALCVIGLVAFGFAATASGSARELTASEVASYVLPDGSLPSLCVTIPDGSGQGKIVKLASDTMGLHKTVAIPAPAHGVCDHVALGDDTLTPKPAAALRHLLYPPGSGPRAPPFRT
jgi:hypothetical protein